MIDRWKDEATGLVCKMLAGPAHTGTPVNGYVAVEAGHPLHGREYHAKFSVPEGFFEREMVTGYSPTIPILGNLDAFETGEATLDLILEVHGGVTFSGRMRYEDEGLWWFGFDTSHYGDGPEQQNEVYVRKECEKLALQLAAWPA